MFAVFLRDDALNFLRERAKTLLLLSHDDATAEGREKDEGAIIFGARGASERGREERESGYLYFGAVRPTPQRIRFRCAASKRGKNLTAESDNIVLDPTATIVFLCLGERLNGMIGPSLDART